MAQEPDLKKAKPVKMFMSKPSNKTIDGKSLDYSWPKMDTTGIKKKISPKDLENIKKGNYKKGGAIKTKKKK